jgi:hypothetical protein
MPSNIFRSADRKGQAAMDLDKLNVVVAGLNAAGETVFLDPGRAARITMPGIVDVAYVWGTPGTPDLSRGIGAPPADTSFPLPGGTRFGLICFPAHSAGKLDIHQSPGVEGVVVDDDNPGMHQSDTIDYEVILSGKVDIVLPSGDRRTLGPGSMLVMGGVDHAWENIYDEPCYYAAILIGARR